VEASGLCPAGKTETGCAIADEQMNVKENFNGSTDSSRKFHREIHVPSCASIGASPGRTCRSRVAGYEVLQELHNRGVLEIMRGALAASDEILEKIVDNARTPRRPFAQSEISSSGAKFLAASSPNGSRDIPGNSRRNRSSNRRAR